MTYDTCTDFELRPVPPTPPMPVQNAWYGDTTFSLAGVDIVRGTDRSTGAGKQGDYVDMDFGLPANEANPWSPSGSRLLVICGGGTVMPLNFDGKNLMTSRVPCPPGDTTQSYKYGGTILNLHGIGDPSYSRTSDDVVLGSDKHRFCSKYNLITNESQLIWDTGPAMNGHLYAFSTGDSDDVLATIGGGTVQDTDYLAAVRRLSTGETHILDSLANTIDGFPFTPVMSKKMHNARLSLCGRYLVIALAGGGGTPYIWDWEHAIVRAFAPNGSGHRFGGYQALINATGPPGGGGPSIAIRQGDNPTDIHYISPESWNYSGLIADTHMSWASVRPGCLTPVMISSYWCSSAPDPYQPGQMATYPLCPEVYGIALDGTKTFFRFTYNRAVGGYSNFGYQPIVHVSPDGRFAAWSSNWDRSLGPNKTGNARIDVFIARLPVRE